MVLLVVGIVLQLLVEVLRLLRGMGRLLVLLITFTLSTRARLNSMGRVVAGPGVAAGLSLRLELSLLFAKLIALAFQAYSLVQQCLEIREHLTLQSIVEWPYQTIQKTILPLLISINFVRRVTRQLSELVPILTD